MFSIFSWVAVLIGSAAAAFQIAEVHRAAVSAPQQAAGAGLALAYVIIPYCFARAIESLARGNAIAEPQASPSSLEANLDASLSADVGSETIVRPRYPAGADGWRKLISDAEKQGWTASTTLGGVTFRHPTTGREIKESRIESAIVALDLRA